MSVIITALFMGALSARGDVYEVSFQGRFNSSTYPTAIPLNSTFTVNVILDYSAVGVESSFSGFLFASFHDFVRGGYVQFGSQDFDHYTTYYDVEIGRQVAQVGTAPSSSSFFFKLLLPVSEEDAGSAILDGRAIESANVVFPIGTGFQFDPVSGETLADYLGTIGGVLPSFLGRSLDISSFAPGGGFYQAMGSISSASVTLVESSIPEPSSTALVIGACCLWMVLSVPRRRKVVS